MVYCLVLVFVGCDIVVLLVDLLCLGFLILDGFVLGLLNDCCVWLLLVLVVWWVFLVLNLLRGLC